MAGKIDYSQINADLQGIEDQQKNRKNFKKFKKIDYWTLKKGDHKLLVLPPLTDDAPLYYKISICYGYVDGKGNKRAYKSSMDKHGRCPLVENWKRLRDAGDTDAALAIQPKTFFLYNVLDANKAVKVLMANTSQHKEILAELQNAGQDGVEVDTDEGARFIKVTRMAVQPWARARMDGKSAGITQSEFDLAMINASALEEVFVDFTPEELEDMLAGKDISKSYAGEEGEEEPAKEEKKEAAPAPKAESKKEEVKAAPKVETPKAEAKPAPKAVEGIPVSSEEDGNDMDDIMALLD